MQLYASQSVLRSIYRLKVFSVLHFIEPEKMYFVKSSNYGHICFTAAEKRLPAPGNNLDPEVTVPMQNEEGEPLSQEEKIEKLVGELKKAYKKNQSLAKANKSLRLQLHQATKKTLSQKTKHEIVREIMSVSECMCSFSIF